jgi:hypothetical protein
LRRDFSPIPHKHPREGRGRPTWRIAIVNTAAVACYKELPPSTGCTSPQPSACAAIPAKSLLPAHSPALPQRSLQTNSASLEISPQPPSWQRGIVRGHMARAGPYRPYHRWRLGPARFGSYRKPVGGVGCFRIYRPSSMPSFGLGRCDRRHKLLFQYPIIFWTPRGSLNRVARTVARPVRVKPAANLSLGHFANTRLAPGRLR